MWTILRRETVAYLCATMGLAALSQGDTPFQRKLDMRELPRYEANLKGLPSRSPYPPFEDLVWFEEIAPNPAPAGRAPRPVSKQAASA